MRIEHYGRTIRQQAIDRMLVCRNLRPFRISKQVYLYDKHQKYGSRYPRKSIRAVSSSVMRSL